MIDLPTLARECAPEVHIQTMMAVISTESSQNPFAIGVVGRKLSKQPTSLVEAVATAKQLEKEGADFAVGIAQIRSTNLKQFDFNYAQAFNPCLNLYASSQILKDCFLRAKRRYASDNDALHAALSCYYSGNFTRGFKADARDGSSYVERVVSKVVQGASVVPPISTGPNAWPLPPIPTPLTSLTRVENGNSPRRGSTPHKNGGQDVGVPDAFTRSRIKDAFSQNLMPDQLSGKGVNTLEQLVANRLSSPNQDTRR